jgi:2-polyprenyl-3-methyl-5-hydroxy-6-metoxy-1,4-benzoquinol methylase
MRTCEVCSGTSFRPFGEKVGHTFVRCGSCGLERIDPPPSDEELARVYGEHYYDAWGLKQDEDAVARLKRGTFQRVVRRAGDLPRGSKVLDCGAATGFLMQVAKDEGYDVYGVELSEFGASEIGRKFGKDHVHQGHLEDAPFEPGTFRAIFMCDFLEHVRDPKGILEKAYQLLAPGGVIGISTPKVGSFTHRTMGMAWTHYKVEHLYYFSSGSLQRLLSRIGFTSYRTEPMWKTMNLKYITHQFSVYPHPLLTRAVNLTSKALPDPLQRATFPILMGELLAYAEKPNN